MGVGESGLQPANYTHTMSGGSLKGVFQLLQKAVGPETLNLRALLGLPPRFPDSQIRSVLTQNLKKERVYLNFLGQQAAQKLLDEGIATRVSGEPVVSNTCLLLVPSQNVVLRSTETQKASGHLYSCTAPLWLNPDQP